MSTTQHKPLSREVILLGCVSFFNDLSSEVAALVLPVIMRPSTLELA